MDRRVVRALGTALFALAMTVVGMDGARAAVTECVGEPPAGTTINGSVTIADGQWCTLHNATVLGDVTVYGSLFMEGGRVTGAVTGDDAQIGLSGTQVAKGISAVRPSAGFFIGPDFLLCGASVAGGVVVRDGVHAGPMSIGGPFCGGSGNKISGSVTFTNNTLDAAIYVWFTQITGNLVCQTSPNPDLQGNTVLGSVVNDCD